MQTENFSNFDSFGEKSGEKLRPTRHLPLGPGTVMYDEVGREQVYALYHTERRVMEVHGGSYGRIHYSACRLD